MRINRKNANVYFLIADQSPNHHSRKHWVSFFDQETACYTGVDVLSRLFKYPVYHFQVKRVKRGYYNCGFTEVCLDPAQMKEGEITQLFMDNLVEAIKESPESWLWSHRRWKLKKSKIS